MNHNNHNNHNIPTNVVFVFCKQKTFPCNFFANVQMNPSSEALQARVDLNVTRPSVGLSPLAAAAAMGTADTVRAMLVARSEVNPKLGGETKRGLNEATVKASDEIQDELDESDHAEMLKRYDRRNNKFCQIRSNVSYQFKP